MSRTLLTLYIAKLDGKIIQSIVGKQKRNFFKYMLIWLLISIPASFSNSMIKYNEEKISILIRNKLFTYFNDKYMNHKIYYKSNIIDTPIKNVDFILTHNIKILSDKLASIFSQFTKPIIDIFLSTFLISIVIKRNIRPLYFGLGTILILYQLLKMLRPPLDKFAKQRQELENATIEQHNIIKTNCEEICFYNGHQIEKKILYNKYFKLINFIEQVMLKKLKYNFWENFIMKYLWNFVGLIILYNFVINSKSKTISGRAGSLTVSSKLLNNIGDSIERLIIAIKELFKIRGYLTTINNLNKLFNNLSKDIYINPAYNQLRGNIENGNQIILNNVPIITPNNEKLIDNINLTIKEGQHTYVAGHNGCGKSSLFRIINGLWPLVSGTIIKPNVNIYYIPQKAYLLFGTLYDQIIYPHTEIHNSVDINKIIQDVGLEETFMKHQNDVKNWNNILSGGERQRISFARLLYHRPKFAILDEATSAISNEIEDTLYELCKINGITIISIAHKESLKKHHSMILTIDNNKITLKNINNNI